MKELRMLIGEPKRFDRAPMKEENPHDSIDAPGR